MKLGIIVINLDRSPERLANVAAQLDALGLAWERLPAVDGKNPAHAPRLAAYSPALNRRIFHRQLSPGEQACYASHRLAWQRILDAGWDGAIVLEDDMDFAPNFPDALAALAANPGKWDALKLMSPTPRTILSRTPLDAAGRWQLGDYLKTPIMAAAHALTADAARRLLAATKCFGRPVDTEVQWWWETGVRFRALLPYPVTINAVTSGASALRGHRGGRHRFYKFLKFRQQLAYNAQIYLRALFRRRP
ncbi:MAG: glycosyltransferase family 25 protein [Puniceicoccales bacterium]|nr:glycosyltransferase family 25 protein [Puniceicoccales bacterium]